MTKSRGIGYEHLKNPNLTKAERKKRDQHVEYLNTRYHTLRDKAIEDLGGKCKVCKSTESLIILNKKATGFIFQRIAFWRESKRKAVLKSCYVVCRSCGLKNNRVNKDRKPL